MFWFFHVLWTWALAQLAKLYFYFVQPSYVTDDSEKASEEAIVAEVVRKPFGHLTDNMMWVYSHPEAGSAEVVTDPWAIHRRLRDHGQGSQWAEAMDILQASAQADQLAPGTKLAEIAQTRRLEAFGDLADLSRKVFNLKTVDESGEQGWSEGMAFLLLMDYLNALSVLKSEFLPLPNSPARPAV